MNREMKGAWERTLFTLRRSLSGPLRPAPHRPAAPRRASAQALVQSRRAKGKKNEVVAAADERKKANASKTFPEKFDRGAAEIESGAEQQPSLAQGAAKLWN